MEFFLVAGPVAIAVAAVAVATMEVHRACVLRLLWRSGAVAEARCLQMYTTTHGGHGNDGVRTRLHHVYEFWTAAGEYVRFEETGGPRYRVAGDLVTVHYDAGYPARATAREPDPAGNGVRVVAAVGVCALFVGFCGFFLTAGPFGGDPFGDTSVPGDTWGVAP